MKKSERKKKVKIVASRGSRVHKLMRKLNADVGTPPNKQHHIWVSK
jgi:predicted transcriptional regulator